MRVGSGDVFIIICKVSFGVFLFKFIFIVKGFISVLVVDFVFSFGKYIGFGV